MMQWKRIRRALHATRGRRWAKRVLVALALVGLFGNFLANDRPLVTKYRGEVRWPVFRQIGEQLGWSSPYNDLPGRSWQRAETDWAIWPLVPYAATKTGPSKTRYLSPFAEQDVRSWRWHHWCGTDRYGRDVLAGLIKGSRTALLVGMVAMSVALLIGLLIGGLAGYFGDDRLRLARGQKYALLLGSLLAGLYANGSLWPFLSGSNWLLIGLATLLLFAGSIALCLLLFRLLRRFLPALNRQRSLRVDASLLRLIELFNSVPTLVFLIAILTLLRQPGLLTIMLIIGLIRWTTIARFVRAELMRIRELPYVTAARMSGFSHARILLRHALPNALGPVIVALAFGMGAAVLLEAFLSFLGIGLPPDEVSWGSLLRASRAKPAAWWLTLFPGLAIFLTVLCLNIVGDALVDKR